MHLQGLDCDPDTSEDWEHPHYMIQDKVALPRIRNTDYKNGIAAIMPVFKIEYITETEKNMDATHMVHFLICS